MCVDNTPLEDHLDEFGLLVKREDACCPGGPNFSKTRGVYMHVRNRNEMVIGVLDTSHSQGGWAIARACKMLGKQCMLYYPVRKSEMGHALKPQQRAALDLGAAITGLPAGRSAILYHQAKAHLKQTSFMFKSGDDANDTGRYMMPNALKLPETVDETAKELRRTLAIMRGATMNLVVSASSATIAAGLAREWDGNLFVHMGYSRPSQAVRQYINKMAGKTRAHIIVIDEGYSYADEAVAGPTPPWPCNSHYDLKAFRWWVDRREPTYRSALFWNVG